MEEAKQTNSQREFKIDEEVLKIGGMVNLSEKLDVGHDYKLLLLVTCYSAELRDNQDGSYNRIYKTKPSGEVEIQADYGEKKMVGRIRGQMSQKLRSAIWIEFQEENILHSKDEEENYKMVMSWIINNLPDILRKIKNGVENQEK